MNHFFDTIQLLFSESESRSHRQSQISHILPLSLDITKESFQANYLRKNPLLFSYQHPTRELLLKLLGEKYSNKGFRIINVSRLSKEFLSSKNDLSSNNQKEKSWWSKDNGVTISDSARISLKDFRAANSIDDLRRSKTMKRILSESASDNQNSAKSVVDDFYLNDCQISSEYPEIRDLLMKHLPTLPNQPTEIGIHSDIGRREAILDWDVDACLSVGRGNITRFSSSGFHIHRHSVSLLLSGRKHWIIFPPDQMPFLGFNPYENLEQWLHSVYPHLTSASRGAAGPLPFEVLQKAGEAVYVPEGWYHAARTLGMESVSVRLQAKNPDPDNYYYYLMDGERRLRAKDLTGAVMSFKLG